MNTRRKPPHRPHTYGETHGYEVSSIASVREPEFHTAEGEEVHKL
jgi:hypothetical protein